MTEIEYAELCDELVAIDDEHTDAWRELARYGVYMTHPDCMTLAEAIRELARRLDVAQQLTLWDEA